MNTITLKLQSTKKLLLMLGVLTLVPVFESQAQALIAKTTTASTKPNTAVIIQLTESDSNGDPLTFSIVTAPKTGTLSAITYTGSASANVTYTPTTGYSGSDSFKFTATDTSGATSTPTTVTISVDN